MLRRRREGAQADELAALLVPHRESGQAERKQQAFRRRPLPRQSPGDGVANRAHRLLRQGLRRRTEHAVGQGLPAASAQHALRPLPRLRWNRGFTEETGPAGQTLGRGVRIRRETRLEHFAGGLRRPAPIPPCQLLEPLAGRAIAPAAIGRVGGRALPRVPRLREVPLVEKAIAFFQPELANLQPVAQALGKRPRLGVGASRLLETSPPEREASAMVEHDETARIVPLRDCARFQLGDFPRGDFPGAAVDQELDAISARDPRDVFPARGGGGLKGRVEKRLATGFVPRVVDRRGEIQEQPGALCRIVGGNAERLLEPHGGLRVLPAVEQRARFLREESDRETLVGGAEREGTKSLVDGVLFGVPPGQREDAGPGQPGFEPVEFRSVAAEAVGFFHEGERAVGSALARQAGRSQRQRPHALARRGVGMLAAPGRRPAGGFRVASEHDRNLGRAETRAARLRRRAGAGPDEAFQAGQGIAGPASRDLPLGFESLEPGNRRRGHRRREPRAQRKPGLGSPLRELADPLLGLAYGESGPTRREQLLDPLAGSRVRGSDPGRRRIRGFGGVRQRSVAGRIRHELGPPGARENSPKAVARSRRIGTHELGEPLVEADRRRDRAAGHPQRPPPVRGRLGKPAAGADFDDLHGVSEGEAGRIERAA